MEIPLGEDGEQYPVEIMDGDTLKRRIVVTAPLCLYPESDEIADFGALREKPRSAHHADQRQRPATGFPLSPGRSP